MATKPGKSASEISVQRPFRRPISGALAVRFNVASGHRMFLAVTPRAWRKLPFHAVSANVLAKCNPSRIAKLRLPPFHGLHVSRKALEEARAHKKLPELLAAILEKMRVGESRTTDAAFGVAGVPSARDILGNDACVFSHADEQ
jgi:hypothetical protein